MPETENLTETGMGNQKFLASNYASYQNLPEKVQGLPFL
jgi:hypothetical protein